MYCVISYLNMTEAVVASPMIARIEIRRFDLIRFVQLQCGLIVGATSWMRQGVPFHA